MPTNYELGLFFHIVGVFGIAGAATAFFFVLSWMRRCQTVQGLRPLAAVAVWTDRMFPLASILVIAAGAFMVQESDGWEWGAGWINTSLIALIVMGAGGGLLMTPRVGAIRKAADAAPDGPVQQELTDRLNDPILWGTLHAFTLALFAIIWNMTTKPSDAQAGMVVVLAFVVGAASALPMATRARQG
jgi:uncharacterized membrane protein